MSGLERSIGNDEVPILHHLINRLDRLVAAEGDVPQRESDRIGGTFDTNHQASALLRYSGEGTDGRGEQL